MELLRTRLKKIRIAKSHTFDCICCPIWLKKIESIATALPLYLEFFRFKFKFKFKFAVTVCLAVISRVGRGEWEAAWSLWFSIASLLGQGADRIPRYCPVHSGSPGDTWISGDIMFASASSLEIHKHTFFTLSKVSPA